MFYKRQEFYRSLTEVSPGIVERVKKAVEDSEKKFKPAEKSGRGYLWEHTALVASLAYRIAAEENEDRLCASLAALFHDAGKFARGSYHADDEAEDEAASRVAREVLEQAGLAPAVTGHVVRAIRSLSESGSRKNKLADIIHDADFLTKSGYLGVAGFFVKSTLRGKNLEAAISEYLSRELTYASCLPQNMRTAAGRKLAVKKARDTIRFYRQLLAELEDVHKVRFRIRIIEFKKKGRGKQAVPVTLVLPVVCAACGSELTVSLVTEKGPKCETCEASVRCSACGAVYDVSFCLPELR